VRIEFCRHLLTNASCHDILQWMTQNAQDWRGWLTADERRIVESYDERIEASVQQLTYLRAMRMVYQRRAMTRRYIARGRDVAAFDDK